MRVLVAGATGVLGKHVLAILQQRGHHARALCRSVAKSTPGMAAEVVYADALREQALNGVADGMDVVFSCLGQTVSGRWAFRQPGYLDVDVPANLNLLREATRSRVKRFVYVSVLHAHRFRDVRYLNAHAQVSDAVQASGLAYAILEPTGFFSAFREIWKMAVRNRGILFGDGEARSNPIHEEDLARICVDTIETPDSAVIPVGGPEILSRRQCVEMAFRSLNRPAKITQVPLWLPDAAAVGLRVLTPRAGDLLQFLGTLSANDFIAPPKGSRTLDEYFASQSTLHR